MGKTLRARVAYVDHDPMVAIHGRALLDVDEATTMIEADIRDLAKIFSDLHVSPMLHGDEPVVVLALDVFLFVGAAGDLAVIVETLGQVLPEGCVMAHSHLRSDGPSASRRPWRSSRCTRRLQRLSPCGPASRSATFSVTGGSSPLRAWPTCAGGSRIPPRRENPPGARHTSVAWSRCVHTHPRAVAPR
ncbi:SAM-dependent methyltransferase [Nonomuraea thailandensis]|uniref:SAM-dependent methyltransferase n=1 Tax=Nonomuraea thailandensis TaxID=1188745 RepID=UPI0036173855